MPERPTPSRAPAPLDTARVLRAALDRLTVRHPRFLEVVAVGGPSRCQALTTQGWEGRTLTVADAVDLAPEELVHAAVADTQGAGALVRAVATGLRPWICAIPVSDGRSPELATLLASGYVPAHHDGELLHLVVTARLGELVPLVRPDGWTRYEEGDPDPVAELSLAVRTWRERALAAWATEAAEVVPTGRSRDAASLARELETMEHSLSWRLTAPLRAARRLAARRLVARR